MRSKSVTSLVAVAGLVVMWAMFVQADERERDVALDQERKERMQAVLREAKELTAAGRHNEARELLQKHGFGKNLSPENEPLPRKPLIKQPEKVVKQVPAKERLAAPEARDARRGHIEHLRQAAEHLHAAGLHEPAEDLQRQAERIEQELAKHGQPAPGNELHRHVHELSQQVRHLNERVEKLEHFIKELAAQKRE